MLKKSSGAKKKQFCSINKSSFVQVVISVSFTILLEKRVLNISTLYEYMKGEIGDIHVETEDKGKSFKTRKGTL